MKGLEFIDETDRSERRICQFVKAGVSAMTGGQSSR
jgi:hypothetical protein